MDDASDKLRKAEYHLGLAREGLLNDSSRADVVNRARAARNRIEEAWLVSRGHGITPLDDKYTLRSRFREAIPRSLHRKVSSLDDRIDFLFYAVIYPEISPLPPEYPWMDWAEEVRICIGEVEALMSHVERGAELPLFRWEKQEDLRPGQWVRLIRAPDGVSSSPTAKVLGMEGHRVRLRGWNRSIFRMDGDGLWLLPSDRPDDDSNAPFERRRTWFDLHPEYRTIPPSQEPQAPSELRIRFTCPCCGYPALRFSPNTISEEPQDYEICILCDWADMCHTWDDHNQDDLGFEEEPECNPNLHHSLREARANFEVYGCMFAPGDEPYFAVNSDPAILRLKGDLRTCFDAMVGESNAEGIRLLWRDVVRLLGALREAIRAREAEYPEAFECRREKDGEVIGRYFQNKWRWDDSNPR